MKHTSSLLVVLSAGVTMASINCAAPEQRESVASTAAIVAPDAVFFVSGVT